MATNVVCAGGFPSVLNGLTRFSNICGAFTVFTTEVPAQHLARAAYTLRDLTVQARLNDVNGATTVRSRIAGANGNQSVSVPASTTGTFQDTVNSDSIASGDFFNSQTVVAGSSGTFRPTVYAYTLEDTTNDTYILHVALGDSQARGTTEFTVLNGFGSTQALEARAQYRLRTVTTFTNLRLNVSANGINDPSTFGMRLDGVDGNLGLSIPANTSGTFEDTINSDVVSANTLINIAMITGAGSHTDSNLVWIRHQLKGDSPNRFSMSAGSSASVGSNSKTFGMLESGVQITNGLEAPMQVQDVENSYVAENLFVRIQTNTKNAASTSGLRVNLADSIITLSIPSAMSGEFEDTTNLISLVAADDINYFLDTSPSSSGTLTVVMYAVQLSEPPPPPPGAPSGPTLPAFWFG